MTKSMAMIQNNRDNYANTGSAEKSRQSEKPNRYRAELKRLQPSVPTTALLNRQSIPQSIDCDEKAPRIFSAKPHWKYTSTIANTQCIATMHKYSMWQKASKTTANLQKRRQFHMKQKHSEIRRIWRPMEIKFPLSQWTAIAHRLCAASANVKRSGVRSR